MLGPESEPWPSVEDVMPSDECPYCEATEGHQPSCPLYLPLCPVCKTRPTNQDGSACRPCLKDVADSFISKCQHILERIAG